MEKVIGVIPGQPMQTNGTGMAPADAGADVEKPTTVRPVTPMGALVNPANRAGRSGDRGVWQGETDWVVESGSHA